MIVGSTGTREGMTEAQAGEMLNQLTLAGAVSLHHGDCQGADEQAHAIGRKLGLWIVGHPPTASGLRAFTDCDELRDPRPFLVRNRDIVRETALLIATPQGRETLRSGTWATIRYARRLRVPLIIITPKGKVLSE